jgi:hypothetical protein
MKLPQLDAVLREDLEKFIKTPTEEIFKHIRDTYGALSADKLGCRGISCGGCLMYRDLCDRLDPTISTLSGFHLAALEYTAMLEEEKQSTIHLTGGAMENIRNQCDGCADNLPVNAAGIHVNPDGTLHMCCAAGDYKSEVSHDDQSESEP